MPTGGPKSDISMMGKNLSQADTDRQRAIRTAESTLKGNKNDAKWYLDKYKTTNDPISSKINVKEPIQLFGS